MRVEINEVSAKEFVERVETATRAADEASRRASALQDTVIKGRLKLALFWVLAVYVAITLHDEHVRRCMVVQTDGKVHGFCDVLFPFHDHAEIQSNLVDEVYRVQQEGRGINDGRD